MKVAVLGASGGMGSFFLRYFQERGESVRGSDPMGMTNTSGTAELGVKLLRSNAEAVRGCDVTIMAVPMDRTLTVAREVLGDLKEGSVLVEISSVKGKVLPALRKLVADRVALLSIHPLFGPALETSEGMKVAVIVRKRERGGTGSDEGERRRRGRGEEGGRRSDGIALARRLFPEARVIPMTRKEHDRAMGVILSLTHLLNIVYAGAAARFLSPEEFMRVSTPNSSMQLTLAEAVLAQDARLSYAIQTENVYSRGVAREASRELRRVTSMVERADWKEFNEHLRRLSKRYKTDERASTVLREIYSAAEKTAR